MFHYHMSVHDLYQMTLTKTLKKGLFTNYVYKTYGTLQEGNRGLSNYLQQGRWIPAFQLSFRCHMLFIIFKVQMISTQQIVQFHCLQIIRIYKQTINRYHGFHGRSPIFFLQCTQVVLKCPLFVNVHTTENVNTCGGRWSK